MKIGIHTGGCERFGERRYEVLRSCGFEAIDLSLADTNAGFYLLSEEALSEALRHEAAMISAAGMIISQVHGPWRWPSQDETEEQRAERFEKMERSIRMTAQLGCRYWVVHPIMPHGTEERGSDLAASTWQLNVSFLRRLLAVAREVGVVICLENMPMPHFSLGSTTDALRLVKELNDEHLQFCLDTGHVAVFPQAELADEVRRLGEHLCVLHIHDNGGVRDEHLTPGEGVIDWSSFVDALREIGFDGVFSLETNPPKQLSCADAQREYRRLYEIAAALLGKNP